MEAMLGERGREIFRDNFMLAEAGGRMSQTDRRSLSKDVQPRTAATEDAGASSSIAKERVPAAEKLFLGFHLTRSERLHSIFPRSASRWLAL